MNYTLTTEVRVDGLYYIFNFGSAGSAAVRAADHRSGQSMLAAAQDQLASTGGIGDGDKGDIIVSGGVWTVKPEILGTGGGGPVTWTSVTGKPTFATVATSGLYSDLTGLPSLFDGSYAALTGKPSTFTPSAHSHAISDTTGLQTALDGKQAAGSCAAASHTHAIGDTTGLQTALDGKAATAHTQAASTITDFASAARAQTEAELVAGANVTITPSGTGATRQLTIAATGGSGGANLDGYTQMVPAAGLFIANSANATALGTQAQVANRTVIAPFVPAYATTIDQLGISISTLLAASNCKVVIYASDANGRPTTILRETANIDCTTTGTKFAAITSLALTAGATYWLGVRSSSTQTLRTIPAGGLPALTYSNAATPSAAQTLILTETFANAAANWTYASSQHSTVLMPLVLMRVA